MNIYFVRHGQTDWNKEFLIQGRIDNPLNEIGENEAVEVAKYFFDVNADTLVSSSLGRAKKTLDIIRSINNWDLNTKIMDEFIESDFGELEGGDAKQYHNIIDFSKYENYESDEYIKSRVMQGVRKLIDEHSDENNIIVVCHSHTMKAFLGAYDSSKYDFKYKLKNCGIIKVNVVNKEINDVNVI